MSTLYCTPFLTLTRALRQPNVQVLLVTWTSRPKHNKNELAVVYNIVHQAELFSTVCVREYSYQRTGVYVRLIRDQNYSLLITDDAYTYCMQ